MSTIATLTPGSKRSPQRIGTRLEWEGFITMTTSYATGGDTLTAKSLGMDRIDGGIIALELNHYYKVVPQTDGSAKLLGKVVTTAAEIANATNLSAEAPYAIIRGR